MASKRSFGLDGRMRILFSYVLALTPRSCSVRPDCGDAVAGLRL
jgi:hypothetical protein